MTLTPVTPFYRIRFDDGAIFDCSGDAEAMRAEITRFAPGDVEGYERFLKASEAIFKVGFEELGDVPFDRLSDMVRIVPAMLRRKAIARSTTSWHRMCATSGCAWC